MATNKRAITSEHTESYHNIYFSNLKPFLQQARGSSDRSSQSSVLTNRTHNENLKMLKTQTANPKNQINPSLTIPLRSG